MTRTEFGNLKFGDKLYNRDGILYVINKIRQDFIQVTSINEFTTSFQLNNVLDKGLFECTFFTEKPKKKVKKEKVMYTDTRGIKMLNEDSGIEITFSDEIDTEYFTTPVTITYETEE